MDRHANPRQQAIPHKPNGDSSPDYLRDDPVSGGLACQISLGVVLLLFAVVAYGAGSVIWNDGDYVLGNMLMAISGAMVASAIGRFALTYGRARGGRGATAQDERVD